MATISHGLDEGKVYLRDYERESEYMVKSGDYPKCQRSFLAEEMLRPALPAMVHLGTELIDGTNCDHYVRDIGIERVHVYFNGKVPVRLRHESVDEGGESTDTMSYDITNFEEVAEGGKGMDFDMPGGWDHEGCERFVGGFPYLHLFHYYLRV